MRSMGNFGPKVSSCRQQRLCSYKVDAQADLSSLDAEAIMLVCHAAARHLKSIFDGNTVSAYALGV